MAELVFPSSPAAGDLFPDPALPDVSQWIWDGSRWNLVQGGGGGGDFLPLSGGALTGSLTGTDATFDNLRAPQAIGDNRIINGDMRIDQRNNGASGTAINAYTVDRWQYGATQPGKATWQQVVVSCPGFPKALRATSSSAYAAAAADTFYFAQPIEADMLSDFGWGAVGAQSVTLSFWAFSSLTGTFSGSLSNSTRSYPFTYSISATNTWTKIAVTIPGDTAGTWTLFGNAAGLYVFFDLGSGANFRAAANAWGNGNIVGATGAVSVVSTNGAGFHITGVKLEVGAVATPFNRQSLAKSMADCQRYYKIFGQGGAGILLPSFSAAAGDFVAPAIYFPFMRSAPTTSIWAGDIYGMAIGIVISSVTYQNANPVITHSGAGYGQTNISIALDAEL